MSELEQKEQEIQRLRAENAQLKSLLEKALARIAKCEARISELEAKLNQNSTNSSRPPSSDPPSVPPKSHAKTGRKPGGQKGHKGHFRQLVPVEQVQQVFVVKPKNCLNCHIELTGDDSTPRRHQVAEIPILSSFVTEYQLCDLVCPNCHVQTSASLPDGVPDSAFGPHLMALNAVLAVQYHLTRRDRETFLADVFGVPISSGSVSQIREPVSQALEKPTQAVLAALKKEPVLNCDETRWRVKWQRAYLWVVSAWQITYFSIEASRSQAIAKKLIGEDYQGIIGTDRYEAYNFIREDHRQFCLSHIERDIQSLIDRGGTDKEVGEELLKLHQKLFERWHRVRDGTLLWPDFQAQARLIARKFEGELDKGLRKPGLKKRGMLEKLFSQVGSLWTFIENKGVEPTNNQAERMIRPSVISRKRSYGTQSEKGSLFFSRMQTMIATLKQQGRKVFGYLVAACTAFFAGKDVPSLLSSS